ncbi:Tripartite ATP-independent transporter, DctQ component [Salinihabitans flavidus]|uniref:TRAP transporter small permease protein n=2 Tax=Salinihabitans flavidus TaxID=569882 RepID=A0A1H8UK28_9RHOB|nr:Tripartite ATP-independent transporter, DctQ component [Salinihabitans flavidus]
MTASALISRWLSRSEIAAAIGLLGLLILSVATFADVIMRGMFSKPIYGLSDLIEIITPPVVASCFPVALAARQNITIRFLGRGLRTRAGQAVELFGQGVTLIVILGIVWRVGDYSWNIFDNAQVTWLLQIPAWPSWFLTTLLLAACIPIQCFVVLETVVNLKQANPLLSELPEPEDDPEHGN